MTRLVDDATVMAATRALLGAITVDTGPTTEQLAVLSAIVHRYWERPDLDLATLEPLSPENAAAGITDPLVRGRVRELMVLLELCRHPLSQRQRDTVEAYAFALGADGPGLELVRDLVDEGAQKAMADWSRRFYAHTDELLEPDLAPAIDETVDDAAARFDELMELLRAQEPGTLGHAYVEFQNRNGFSLSPEKATDTVVLFAHDMTHVIAGYDATPEGEVCLGAMKLMITDSDIHWLELLGSLAIHEGMIFGAMGYDDAEPAMARAGAPEMLAHALERGSATAKDFSTVDHVAMVGWPLERVRAEFGVPD